MTYTLFVLPHTISAVILFFIGAYSLRHRRLSMALPFGLLMIAAGLWSLFYTLEITLADPQSKIWLAKARFIGLAPLSTLWLMVGIEHIKPKSPKSRKIYGLLSILPICVIVLSLTSSHHNVFRYAYGISTNRHFSLVTFKNGTLFWIYAIYSYSTAIATGFILQRNFRTHNIIKRRQAVLISLAITLFIVVDILFQAGITPIKGYTLSPAALAISGIMMGIAVFHYRILDLAPITRKMIMNSIADIIFIVDDDLLVLECNRAAATTFGFRTEKAEGLLLSSIHKDLAIADNAGWGTWSQIILINGKQNEFEITTEPVLFSGKHAVARLIYLRNVTEQRAMEAEIRKINQSLLERISDIEKLQDQLKDQAIRDPLTSLFNRRYLDEALERDFSLIKRNQLSVSFVMLDIDRFKNINDSWGHQAGDTVLKKLASIIKTVTRKSDIACRYGGEEFLLVLNGANEQQAMKIAEEIRTIFASAAIELDGRRIPTTLSGGIAAFTTQGDTPDSIIKKADEALYQAKKAGRDRIMVAGERSGIPLEKQTD